MLRRTLATRLGKGEISGRDGGLGVGDAVGGFVSHDGCRDRATGGTAEIKSRGGWTEVNVGDGT